MDAQGNRAEEDAVKVDGTPSGANGVANGGEANGLDARETTPPGRLRRWGPLAALLALLGLGYLFGWHEHLTLSNLIRERFVLSEFVSANIGLAALIYMAVYVVAVAASFPGASLLTIIGGFLFGWLVAGSLTAVSATLGAMLIFLAARSSLGSALAARAGPSINRLAKGFREDAFHYLLFLRLAPVFPFWLVNIAPALFDMRLKPYLIATFLGILPGTFAYAFVGAGLDSVIMAQEQANPGCAAAGTCAIDLSAFVTRDVILAFAALGLAALIPVAVRKWRARGRAGEE
ncbi:TVP38/TMEM64 family protein [Stappia indica]|uniref:TVP38/TMEM64 family protein n=1 Tax=Stappia indica TaxID=538381 RepID=UPI001CD3D087|nr:TVP38/TMEM64 family protein [Stappia indica]MCA1297576.1 TVP38/TMEM64 family protein [Stappia indica]